MKIKGVIFLFIVAVPFLGMCPVFSENELVFPEPSEKAGLKMEDRVRVKRPKEMAVFLKNIRPEAPVTVVLKNRKIMNVFYSQSNKRGVEVWLDENFDLDARRAFYYHEIKYLEAPRSSFVEQP